MTSISNIAIKRIHHPSPWKEMHKNIHTNYHPRWIYHNGGSFSKQDSIREVFMNSLNPKKKLEKAISHQYI